MKRVLRGILFVIFVLIAVAAIIPFVITADTFKSTIIEQVEAKTKRKLTIDGTMHLRLFPEVGVVVEKVALSGAPGKKDTAPFIAADQLKVSVELWPLLQRSVVVKSLTLENPHLNLHAYADGTNNWEFTTPEKAAAKQSEQHGAGEVVAAAMLGNLNLEDVSLRGGQVHYVDDVHKKTVDIKAVYLKLSLDGLNAPLKVDGSADWQGKTIKVQATLATPQKLLAHAPVEVDLSVRSDLLTGTAKGTYEVKSSRGKVAVASPSLKELQAWLDPKAKPINTSMLLALNAASDVACNVDECILKPLNITLDKLTLKGEANIGLTNPVHHIDLTCAECYGGQAHIMAQVDTTHPATALVVRSALKDVQLGALLKDTAQITNVSAKTNANAILRTQGATGPEMTANLSGDARVEMDDGTITGIDLLEMLHNVQSAFAGKGSSGQTTAFSRLTATLKIAGGVVNNNDLTVQMTGMNVAGVGQVDLPRNTIHFRLTPQMLGKGQDGKAAGGLAVPVLIEGSLDHPTFQPDVAGTIQNIINDPKQFKEQLKNSERSIKGLLKGLKDFKGN